MITQEEVARIARLSHLSFSAAELDALTQDMEAMVAFAHTIADAAAGEAPFEGFPDAQDRLRGDEVAPSWPQQAILSAVSGGERGFFPVKRRELP